MHRTAIVCAATVSCVLFTYSAGALLAPILVDHFGDDAAAFSKALLLLPIVGVIVFNRRLRSRFPIRLPWTWVCLIPLAFIAVNVSFLGNPDRISWGLPLAAAVTAAFSIGLEEELFFRGFAFLGAGETTPKLTVLLTSFMFAAVHLVNLSRDSLAQVVGSMLIALAVGFAFGVIRVVTGSIAWCVLFHGVTDLTSSFANYENEAYKLSAFAVTIVSLGAGYIVVFKHPAMNPRSQCSGGLTPAPPNGGPAMRPGNLEAGGRPPSVS